MLLASLLLVVTALAASPRPAHGATLPCSVRYGVYETNTPWDPNETAVKNLDAAVNRHSSIIHWFAQWGDNGSGNFSANQPWMLSNVRAYSSVGVMGSTPFITWEPWGPAPYTAANNTFPLQQIAAGTFDSYVDSWANGLHTYGGPVLLDFGHEMDGNWFPWGYGVNGNTPADFIAAYRHVHDRFALAGASNVQFVWTANVWNPSSIDQECVAVCQYQRNHHLVAEHTVVGTVTNEHEALGGIPSGGGDRPPLLGSRQGVVGSGHCPGQRNRAGEVVAVDPLCPCRLVLMPMPLPPAQEHTGDGEDRGDRQRSEPTT